jgi:hypothetical protein
MSFKKLNVIDVLVKAYLQDKKIGFSSYISATTFHGHTNSVALRVINVGVDK